MLKKKLYALLALASVLGAGPVLAAGPDYSELSDAITFDTVAPVILSAGAALVTLFVIIKGVKIVLAMVRS
jgi:hypothetical protein